MILSDIDNITQRIDPPTRETIERERARQIEVLRDYRRQLVAGLKKSA